MVDIVVEEESIEKKNDEFLQKFDVVCLTDCDTKTA